MPLGELLEGKPHEQFLWGGAGNGPGLVSGTAPVPYPTAGPALHKDDAAHGDAQLQEPRDDPQGALGISAPYNLIRLLMAQAAHNAGIQPRQVSFKHTVQMWTTWTSQNSPALDTTGHAVLFRLIGQRRVGNRPRRVEPRARKRRPKPFPWLKIPRARARRKISRHRHRLYA